MDSTTLDYIVKKFNLNLNQKRLPIEILPINRMVMAQTLAELGFKVGAEIGVASGEHAELLCKNIPGLHLYCIDAWQYYHGYTDYMGKTLERFYNETAARLQPYNCTIIRKFSMDAVNDFDDGSLDFVYIDAAHDLKNVISDLCEWNPKVRKDGIVFGHDYKRRANHEYHREVVEAVQCYAYTYRINPWFTLGEQGQPDGLYKEGQRSWMWVVR
jgi:predicted O-methyltransferase YrrM